MGSLMRLLIVEDSEDDALLITEKIKKGGRALIFERVETEEEMRRALDEESWDIIVADYKLPHFNAHDALQVLKEKHIDIPFIIVSGCVGEETAAGMMKDGAHDYIMKNNLARLCGAVDRELKDAGERRLRRAVEEEIELYRAQLEDIVDKRTVELNEKVKALEKAMEHIRTLEGLVPTCANCKRMLPPGKDPREAGAWVPMETYISERTKVEFTHGICPDCVEKLYGKK